MRGVLILVFGAGLALFGIILAPRQAPDKRPIMVDFSNSPVASDLKVRLLWATERARIPTMPMAMAKIPATLIRSPRSNKPSSATWMTSVLE